MSDLYSVLAARLNIRDAPISGAVLGILPRGQIVENLKSSTVAGWLNVSTYVNLKDITGYVTELYLTPTEDALQPDPMGDATVAVTVDKLKRLTPSGSANILASLASGFAEVSRTYEIHSASRLCHFLAQAAHESMGFTRLRELGGPSYFRRYEGRADLGNNDPGDGVKYHGRGIFRLTGKSNYRIYGEALGLDLLGSPDLAMRPDISLKTAALYWKNRKLNDLADRDDIRTITRRINGGFNGLSERELYLRKAKSIWR